MAKQVWKPGNMLYPLPVVLVSTADKEGCDNILTIAWTGTVCTDPAMLYISVRKERYSYHLLKESGEFVVNLATEPLKRAVDWCGVRSGASCDKWKEMNLTRGEARSLTYAPVIKESPVNIECRVSEVKELGSHDMFLAKVTAIQAEDQYMDEHGRFDFSAVHPITYAHGAYFCLGRELGKFGWSVKKKKKKKKRGKA